MSAALIILGFLLLLLGLGIYAWIPQRVHGDRLHGWWHYQTGHRHPWTPRAWADACDLSTERSRARRR